MLTKRVVTSVWGIPLLIIATWFEQPLPWFTILITLWGLLAVYEFYRMVSANQLSPLATLGIFFTGLFIVSRNTELLAAVESGFNSVVVLPLLVGIAVILPAVILLFKPKRHSIFSRWLWTVTGIIYIGLLLGHLVSLKGLPDGRNWVFLAFLVTFASDTFAFFIGSALGRHKLMPHISPGKTIEGALGGLAASSLVSLLFIIESPFSLPIMWWQAVILGLTVGFVGQFGDMVESALKRKMKAKDSGRYLPGHGGFLDRVDSLLFSGVVVYYFVILFII